MWDLLSCLMEKFSGYEIPIPECENKERTLFTPVNIIFDLVKHQV